MFGAIGLDKPLGKFLVRIMDLLSLNLWFLLYCLPIFTVGAATSALYQVTIAMADNRAKEPAREFRQAFRENFARATPVWLGILLVFLFIVMDLYLNWLGLVGERQGVWYGLLLTALVLLLDFADWTWALMAKFVSKRRLAVKNAMMFTVRFHLISWLFTAAGIVFTVFVFSRPYFWPAALWLGFSFPAWLKGKFYRKVFAPYIAQIMAQEN